MKVRARASILGPLAICVVLVFGMGLIVSGWTRLSATTDEGTHLAAGLEWWQDQRYTLWTENPPLARILAAALPFASGTVLPSDGVVEARADTLGKSLLCDPQNGHANLVRARAGVLLFYPLAILAVAILAWRSGGRIAAAVAATSFASLPPVLAHAGIAGTDIAFVATILLAIWGFVAWHRKPTIARACLAGLAAASALLCKFTALTVLPTASTAIFLALPPQGILPPRSPPRLIQILIGVMVCGLLVWATYHFSFGWVDARRSQYENPYFAIRPPHLRQGLQVIFTAVPLPAPDFFNGLLFLVRHNEKGHAAYLLGEVSQSGFSAFYPLALFWKAPLPFLLLVGVGVCGLVVGRRSTEATVGAGFLAAAGLTLLALMPMRVNIGVRHALVVYAFIALATGLGWSALWPVIRQSAHRNLLVLSLVALGAAGPAVALGASPNFLSYFNAFAAQEPGRRLIDSDLDWGQGRIQLAEELRRRGISEFRKSFPSSCASELFFGRDLEPGVRTAGWIVVSEHRLWESVARARAGATDRWGLAWLEGYSPAWRQAGLRLYLIPEIDIHDPKPR